MELIFLMLYHQYICYSLVSFQKNCGGDPNSRESWYKLKSFFENALGEDFG